MRITNLLPIITVLVGMLSSCQLGPFYYTLDRDRDVNNESCIQRSVHRETPISHKGNHGAAHAAGSAYSASINAVLMAKNAEDMTDEEIREASDYPRYEGNGYSDGQWYAEHPNEVAYEGGAYHNGRVVALNPDEIVKLHIIESEDGKIYLWDDVTGEMWLYEFEEEVVS